MALDYSFLNQDEPDTSEGPLDYSFLGGGEDERVNEATGEPLLKQRETYDMGLGEAPSNLGRVMERVKLMQTRGVYGIGRAAVTADPNVEETAERLSMVGKVAESAPTAALPSILLAGAVPELVDFVASLGTKGVVDVGDMLTAGDIRADVGEASEIVSKEAQRILGSPEMQYTGNDAQRLGWEVVEGAANMVPALALGWATRNPGVTLGAMGFQVAGNTYNDYMDKTGDHQKALLAAQFHVAAEVVPETIPVLAILRKTKAGEGVRRMLEATIGEGAQEMLTEILQGTYDRATLEEMSLADAIRGIDWGDVAHAGTIGFFVGGTLATPGAIADAVAGRKLADQQGNPPELFTPTHKVAGGQDAQPVTRKGKLVPDTYITESGEIVRDSNAVEITPPDLSMDISANVEAIKDAVYNRQGIVADAMQQAPEMAPVEMPTGLPEIEPSPAPAAEVEAEPVTKPAEGLVAAQAKPRGIIDQVAHEEKHATEPVEPTGWARATAVEYQTKHPHFGGLILTHRPGDTRFDHKAEHYYGELAETVDADGMPKDVILNKDYNADRETPIFIASQLDKKTRDFRQNKILAGFTSEAAARKGFIEQFGDNLGGIKEISLAEFERWTRENTGEAYAQPDTNAVVSPEKPVQQPQKRLEPKRKPVEAPVETPVVGERTIEPQGPEVNINVTSTGQDLKGRLAVVEGDQLIASNDDAGNVNPLYPAELQPRDRAKASSMLQIQKMAADLRPELLADNGKANGGSPIIGPDGVVESGNGRTMAILRAYRENQAQRYREYLKQNAAAYGLTEAEIDAMQQPVLVRVRDETMDINERAEFARQANQSGVAPMTPVENAQADAKRITDEEMQLYRPSDLGNVLASSNQPFLEAFGKRLGDLAVGGLSTPDGRWTKQMADRVQAAVFYKAYENENLLALMAEEADPDIKNILNALNKAAPAFARARAGFEDLGDLDIIHDIVGAIDVIRRAKNEGTSVKQILDQGGLFGDVDPVIGAIAEFIESGARSPKRLGIGFTEMANFLENELRNLNQESLFDLAPATKADIVAAANQRITEVYGQEKGITDLFAQAEDRPESPGRVPEPGPRVGEQAAVQGAEAEATRAPGELRYEIPETGREDDLSIREEQAIQWDLFSAQEIPAETAKQQAADNFFTRYEQVETGTFNSAYDTVSDPADVAHVVAQIRKHAQELFLAVVTDEKGKILNIIRHSKGTIDGASVYPGVVAGAIASTPGSKKVWFAHNHPSGYANPSRSDYAITETITKMMDGLDVDFQGHVVVANEKYSFFMRNTNLPYLQSHYIPPAPRKKRVPVTERILRKRDFNQGYALESPSQSAEYIDNLESDAGILLLNNRNKPVGVMSISPAEMGQLRDNGTVRRILSGIDKTNANAAITFAKRESGSKPDRAKGIKNLNNYLAKLKDLRILDAFVYGERGMESWAATGKDLGSVSEPFFRRADPYAGFDGKDISYQVEVEDTGKTYTVTVDAAAAMRDIDTRLNALRELRGCI